MITKLEEDGKTKADRYWPSKVGKSLKLDNQMSIKFVEENATVEIITRRFQVKHQGKHLLVQIQNL